MHSANGQGHFHGDQGQWGSGRERDGGFGQMKDEAESVIGGGGAEGETKKLQP